MTFKLEFNAAVAYPDTFFDAHQDGALQSARIVLRLLQRLFNPSSVIDVGCGRGAWLRAFQELGITKFRGIDGGHVDRSKLLIPSECFTCADLSKPFEVHGRYDLAVCLEVAEHLPEKMAPILVSRLVEAAPAVLFSAAVPGQGGVQHVNEQMPAYWRTLFQRQGYALLDPLRPAILTDTRIEWWYRQNIILYVAENTLRERPALEAYRVPEDELGIEWVHSHILDRQENVQDLSRRFCAAVRRALRRRIEHLSGPSRVSSSEQL